MEVIDESDFALLPNEILIKVCKRLETPALLTMSQAYSRAYRVCREVINRREKEYKFDKLVSIIKRRSLPDSLIQITEGGKDIRIGHSMTDLTIASFQKGLLKGDIFLPSLRIFGEPEDIRVYLLEEGFTSEEADLLISEGISQENYQERKDEFISEFGDKLGQYGSLFG